MESKNRHVLGRSIVLERQERFSFETSERIYIKNTQLGATRLYHNPPVPATNKLDPSNTSISSCIEKIELTRQRVDCLNDRINHEIDRLKEVHSHFKSRNKSPKKIEMTTNKHMTWGENFSANRSRGSPLATNKHHGSGRERRLCSCPGPECKPYCQIVDIRSASKDKLTKHVVKDLKKKELMSRIPPLETNEIPAKRLPPEKLPPKELPPKRLPPEKLPPKDLPPEKLPPENLPPKELPPIRLPPKELPPRKLPPKELPPRKLPPKDLTTNEFPPKRLPSKELPPKRLPSKELPPKNIPSRELPPKRLPPKEVPPKRLPSKERLPRELPPKRLPSKERLPRELPPKRLPSKERHPRQLPLKEFTRKPPPKHSTSKELKPGKPPPKDLPPKKLAPKELPPKKLPSKEFPPRIFPPKELPERRPPPKSSTQKELMPGKPPPQKPPSKELMTRNPPPKEEPMKKELDLEELTPEELTSGEPKLKQLERRFSGGCCPCCYNYDASYCSSYCYQDPYCSASQGCHCVGQQLGGYPCCNVGHIQGIQYGVPYCVTARRQVTDLNTQETISNRNSTPKEMPSQQCSSKQTVSSSAYRSKSRENRSPVRRAGTTENKNVRRKIKEEPLTTTYKMQRQEKVLKVEGQEKQLKIRKRGNALEVEGREKIRKVESQEKVIKVQILSQEEFQSPADLKREKSKWDAQRAEVTDAAPPQALGMKQTSGINERMYQDYLRLYYQENSKENIRAGKPLKSAATYTRLEGKEEKIFKEEPRTRYEKREQALKPSDRIKGQAHSKEEPQRAARSKDRQKERKVVRPQKSPEAFSYDNKPKGIPSGRNNQECTDYQSSSPQSDPSLFSYKTCRGERGNKSPNDNSTRIIEPKSDYRTLPHLTLPFLDDRFLNPNESRAYSQHSKATGCQANDRQLVCQERTESTKERVVVCEVPKSVKRDRSSSPKKSKSPHIMESSSSSIDPPSKREVVKDTSSRKESPSCEKSTQVFQDFFRPQRNLSPEPFGARLSLNRASALASEFFAQNPSTDSSSETIVVNPHYQSGPKDSQSSEINRDELSDTHSSDEESEVSVHFDPTVPVRKLFKEDLEDNRKHAFPILSGKEQRSGNESPYGIIRHPTSNELKASQKREKSDYESCVCKQEESEEDFRRKPEKKNDSPLRQTQKHKSMLRNVDQEDNEYSEKSKHKSMHRNVDQEECEYSEKNTLRNDSPARKTHSKHKSMPEKVNQEDNEYSKKNTQSKHKSMLRNVDEKECEYSENTLQSKHKSMLRNVDEEECEYSEKNTLRNDSTIGHSQSKNKSMLRKVGQEENEYLEKNTLRNGSPARQTHSKHKSMPRKVEQEDNEYSGRKNTLRNDSPIGQSQSKHKSVLRNVNQEDNEYLENTHSKHKSMLRNIDQEEYEYSEKNTHSRHKNMLRNVDQEENEYSGKKNTLRNDSPIGQSQSKHKSTLRSVDQEDNEHSRLPKTKEEDIQSRSEYDGYESARSYDPNHSKHSQLSRPQKGGEDKMPIVETLCERRTRTVTFEDGLGDLDEHEQSEEHCHSRIDWERALKYRLTDRSSDQYFTDDNYTSRSSSSAEHTCIESSCDEGEDYDSCVEALSRTEQGRPPFRACPCMYDTYRHLTALCQSQRPFYG